MPSQQTLTLNSGDKMPVIGLGTWKAEKGVTAKIVEAALKHGYRHLDCAADYGNEQEVGQGIKAAIAAGVCKREDIFVTSKLWNSFHAKEHVKLACEKSLKDLGLDYIDLYLVHFPIALKFVPIEERYPPEWMYDPKGEKKMILADVPIRETWEGMEALVDAKLARNIGVSNFNVQLLMDLMRYARIKPAVNQVELHPYLAQKNLVEFCQLIGVVVTGYSPFGGSSYVSMGMASDDDNILENETLKKVAKRVNRSTAQVALRWAIQRGYVVIPKTSKEERLDENFQAFDFELSQEDMKEIYSMDRNRRFNDPAVYCPKSFKGHAPIFD